MKSLHSIQRASLAAFVEGNENIAKQLFVGKHIAIAARNAVYQNNHRQIFRNALRTTFGVTEALVGDSCFRSLCIEYARTRPSSSGDLQDFGQDFPSMLDALYAAGEFRYLGDVARLEQAIEACLLGPHLAAIDPQEIAAIPAHQLHSTQFLLAPSLQVVESNFPILSIWRSHQRAEEASLRSDAEGERVLLVRGTIDVQMSICSELTAQLIKPLQSKLTLAQALDSIPNEILEDSASDALLVALQQMWRAGALVEIG